VVRFCLAPGGGDRVALMHALPRDAETCHQGALEDKT
jgi:hypothetical protein